MTATTRPQSTEFAPHAKPYVERVPEGDVIRFIAAQTDKTLALFRSQGEERAGLPYAPGKWTLKQTLGHMSDTERILSCRVLRIARGDTTPLPGFEQDDYIPFARSNERSLEALMQEFSTVRAATLSLLQFLSPEDWHRTGTVSGFPVSVRGLIFTLAGHELHHVHSLKQHLPGAAID